MVQYTKVVIGELSKCTNVDEENMRSYNILKPFAHIFQIPFASSVFLNISTYMP